MKVIPILHLADLHIGMENYGHLDPATELNGRVTDSFRRVSEVVHYAQENEGDLVLFPSDAYKTQDPNSTYRREFARRIKRLAAGEVRPCDRWSPAHGSGSGGTQGEGLLAWLARRTPAAESRHF